MANPRWRIQVVAADLKNDDDLFSKMDPYVTLTHDGNKFKTATLKNGGTKPVWKHQRMKVGLPEDIPEDEHVHVELYDWDRWSGDDLIGEADIPLTDIIRGETTDDWFDLNIKGKFAGRIHLRSW